MDYQVQIEELMEQVEGLPDGPSRMALLEEAVRLADVHQDIVLADELRDYLIRTATFSGYPEKALAAFSWRLAQADRAPDNFAENDLLWQYKWIVGKLTHFPQITRKQIEDALDDLARRSLRCGCGLRAVYSLRWEIALEMHEPDRAREYFHKWQTTPRDRNTDCAACEQDRRIRFHLFAEENEKAVELAEPILNGSMSCAEIPHLTYARLLQPLLQLEQFDKAVECFNNGYRLIYDNREFLEEAAKCLVFLTFTGNLPQALQLFERHLDWALETNDLYRRWLFYLAACLLMICLVRGDQSSLHLRLPKTMPAYREDGGYESAALASWFEEECRELAQRFDVRNGNDGFTRRLDFIEPLRKAGEAEYYSGTKDPHQPEA